MVKVALWVRLEAKPGKEDEVASFLTSGLTLVQQEPGTTAWFAIRLVPDLRVCRLYVPGANRAISLWICFSSADTSFSRFFSSDTKRSRRVDIFSADAMYLFCPNTRQSKSAELRRILIQCCWHPT